MKSFRLTFPAETKLDRVAETLSVLAAEPRGSSLRPASPTTALTIMRSSGVSWWMQLDGRRARRLQSAAQRSLSGVRWDETDWPDLTVDHAVELRASSNYRLFDVSQSAAAMARVLGVATELGPDETVLLQWQIGSAVHRRPVEAATSNNPDRHWWDLPVWPERSMTPDEVRTVRQKSQEQVFRVVGRIAVAGASGRRARQLVGAVVGGFRLLSTPGMTIRTRLLPSWWAARRFTTVAASPIQPVIHLSTSELAAVIGWPIGAPDLPGVRYSETTPLRLDKRSLVTSARSGSRVIGEAAYPGQIGRLAVLRSNDALRHLHVLGPTGVGKSTLLANLALADIAAGRGAVVIDPKGDLVETIIERVADENTDRIVLIDPMDPAPVGFNPLIERRLGVDGVLHVMRSLWHDSWGPRLGDVLHAGLLTLDAEPGHGLPELPVLLSDVSFRRPLVAAATRRDPVGLGSFWPWYEQLSAEARAQVLAPVMNKLRAFLMRPELMAVLGQTQPRFNLAAVFTANKVALVRLPKGELGSESAQLLGSLLVAHVWRLVLARSAVPADRRQPVFFYLDEFQDFLRLPIDLSDALVQARGMHVGLILAHQGLHQLDRDMKASILANAASRVAFRLDHDDATVIAKRGRGTLRPEDLSGLGAFEAYASLSVAGDITNYGSIRTLPLPAPVRDLSGIRQRNRDQYGTLRGETEAALRALVEGGSESDNQAPGGVIGGRHSPKDGSR